MQTVLSPEELAFVAEDARVWIVPTMPMDTLELLSGPAGPLVPQVPAQVPLWLAVYLAKRNRCTMKPPDWLSKKPLEVSGPCEGTGAGSPPCKESAN